MTHRNDRYLDMWQGDSTNGVNPVTDETSLSSDTRSSWLYEAAAEDFIRYKFRVNGSNRIE